MLNTPIRSCFALLVFIALAGCAAQPENPRAERDRCRAGETLTCEEVAGETVNCFCADQNALRNIW